MAYDFEMRQNTLHEFEIFLPRDAICQRDICYDRLSARVRHKSVFYQNGKLYHLAKNAVYYTPSESSLAKFQRSYPQPGVKYICGALKLATFDQYIAICHKRSKIKTYKVGQKSDTYRTLHYIVREVSLFWPTL